MADSKLTDLPELTVPADADAVYMVDASDTTDDAAGSSKRTLWSTIKGLFVQKTGETDAVDLSGSAGVTVPGLTSTDTITVNTTNGVTILAGNDTATPENVALVVSAGDLRYIAKPSNRGMQWYRSDQSGRSVVYQFADFNAQAGSRWELQAAENVRVPTPPEGSTDSAAKVVAFDSVTGRYAVQGPNGVIEQGDTGWRDVSGSLLNGWTASVFEIRRVGHSVDVHVAGLSGGSADAVLQWPSGFTPNRYCIFPVSRQLGVSNAATWDKIEARTDSLQAAPGQDKYCTIGFTSSAIWPTSLPGTPA